MKTHGMVRCPGCHGPMVPTELHCDACELTVAGRFAINEFAALADDDLHFLRIFVLCEGRIREMESALGVSYPTIKTRLAKLKETLTAKSPAPAPISFGSPSAAGTGSQGGGEQTSGGGATALVLRELEAGRISFDQAMQRIREIQKEGPS